MCGLVGAYNPNKIDRNYKNIIKSMADEIIHRGPDSDGYYLDKNVAFGFRRLSMIDLSNSGSQPFYTKDKSKVMVFNGEIYNYKAIKEELAKEGYEFTSKTDSEVLLYGFDKWGEKILDKVRGMFGFSVWDIEKEELFVARDFFGIKPMYYTKNTKDGSLLFGSEIKSFLKNPNFIKELNKKMLQPYLEGRENNSEETFFKGVYKLKPGHFLKIKNKDMIIKQYWNIEVQKNEKSKEEYVENLKKIINESIALHKETDVKLGAFLTKASDVYVSSLSNPTNTFGFILENEERLPSNIEAKYHNIKIMPEECFSSIAKIQYLLDEPNSSFSCMELYFLSQEAKNYVTAIITGDGAEGFFIKNNDKKTKEELEYKVKKINEILKEEFNNNIEEAVIGNSIENRISEEKLLIADKMSSAQNIEMRSPFIDRKVVEEISKVPKEFIDVDKELKGTLENILGKISLKKVDIIDNPINNWLKEEKYFSIVKEEIKLNVASGYLYSKKLEELLEEESEHKYDLIWNIYIFLLWYKEYFIKR